MNRTVRLELQNARAHAAVAGQVAFALVVKCGAGPLEADRLRCAIRDAAAAADGQLRLDAILAGRSLTLTLRSDEPGWADAALRVLETHGGRLAGGGVELTVSPARLRSVPSDV